jgi:ADP-ribose pyrophosphatase
MDIKVERSEIVYSGPVFKIRQDVIYLPNGKQARIDVVDHRNSVTILPLDTQGQVWFIRQYRQPIGRFLLELPAGVSEEYEDSLASAQRELREEIGMAAGRLEPLGSFFLAPGYSNEYMTIYLAQNLSPAPLPGDEDEIIEIEKISAREAIHLAENGKLEDSKSLISLFWARPYFEKIGLI